VKKCDVLQKELAFAHVYGVKMKSIRIYW